MHYHSVNLVHTHYWILIQIHDLPQISKISFKNHPQTLNFRIFCIPDWFENDLTATHWNILCQKTLSMKIDLLYDDKSLYWRSKSEIVSNCCYLTIFWFLFYRKKSKAWKYIFAPKQCYVYLTQFFFESLISDKKWLLIWHYNLASIKLSTISAGNTQNQN